MRLNTPFSFSFDKCFSTALLDRPTISAISCAEMDGFSLINRMIFSELFYQPLALIPYRPEETHDLMHCSTFPLFAE
jgi:hypothetical protein